VASGLFTKMARLYWHFTWPEQIHGIRVAKTHKVLHPKRPALYPILDAQLKRLYAPQAAAWLNQLVRHEVACDEWRSLKGDRLMSVT
jgi:hypothetical protein